MNNLRELINAVFDGKTIQWDFTPQDGEMGWGDCCGLDQQQQIVALCKSSDLYCYRIKPEKKVVQYRNHLYKDGQLSVWSNQLGTDQSFYQNSAGFGKWIGDTQEYEVEE